MPPQTTMATVTDFQQQEARILTAINSAANGAQLFLADPFRFLSEHGLAVSPELQAQLRSRAPALAKTPTQLYDSIAAGRASLFGDPTSDITWHISSLGVTL